MKRKTIIGICILLIIAFFFIFFYEKISVLFSVDQMRLFIDSFGLFGSVIYGILYFVVTLVFIPTSALTVFAGVLFGKFVGTVVVVISATLAASIAFLLSRYFGKSFIGKFTKGKHIEKWFKKIEQYCETNGFIAFFILRSLFLPYILLSYAAGLVKTANFWDFTLATFLTNIMYSFMFVYLGDSLLQGPKALIIPVILIILVLQVPKVTKWIQRRKCHKLKNKKNL